MYKQSGSFFRENTDVCYRVQCHTTNSKDKEVNALRYVKQSIGVFIDGCTHLSTDTVRFDYCLSLLLCPAYIGIGSTRCANGDALRLYWKPHIQAYDAVLGQALPH